MKQYFAQKILPRCQVALITATSIINHTIDDLLRWANGCREVVLLGGATPLIPELLETSCVTMLAGAVVKRPAEILRVISEAGGMRRFGPYIDKVSLRR